MPTQIAPSHHCYYMENAIWVSTDNIFNQLSPINSDLITTFDNPKFARIWPVMHLKTIFTHLSGPTVGYTCVPVIVGGIKLFISLPINS